MNLPKKIKEGILIGSLITTLNNPLKAKEYVESSPTQNTITKIAAVICWAAAFYFLGFETYRGIKHQIELKKQSERIKKLNEEWEREMLKRGYISPYPISPYSYPCSNNSCNLYYNPKEKHIFHSIPSRRGTKE